MIDYDKLKVVHELMGKIHGSHKYVIGIQLTGLEEPIYLIKGYSIDYEGTIDGLLTKLIEKGYHRGFGEDTDYHAPIQCQHESDTPDDQDYLKCKKCGKFYR